MLRLSFRVVGKSCLIVLLVSLAANSALGQLETATVSGQVVDPSGSTIAKAQVKLVDIDRDSSAGATTNGSGLYTFQSVRPGRYRMEVTAAGFKVVNVTGLVINVQDHIEQNFRLQIGSVAESVTVTAGAPLVNTTDATVSTVVDRQFAENLPMNGRSFQTLIELAPGVVVAPSTINDGGQFNVNGQRAASNYWMVDGVSANIGMASYSVPGNGLAGTLGSFSAGGGTNSLVSVDALQEFRIQTSTYAPEFGRTPGGQISIVTRSGTNQFHGTLFDYLRNDKLDANNWFADNEGLPKPEERQNDFGGTFSGPIIKDRTFFFFSYEGLRLRLPQVGLTTVPDLSARQNAIPALQPFLNAYPFDPKQPDLGNGIAQFNASYSNPSTLDAYSLRIDHKLNDKLTLFGRYNYSPSNTIQRGDNTPLSGLFASYITTQTATLGLTWIKSANVTNDLRFNYSRATSSSDWYSDGFGGAVPLSSLPFPSPYTSQNAVLFFAINSLAFNGAQFVDGRASNNLQRQFNVVDNVTIQKGSHGLKFGVDYRRLSPVFSPFQYSQGVFFNDVPSAEIGDVNNFLYVQSGVDATFLFRNLGLFAQDTWRLSPRVTVTYGLRWDLDFVPSTSAGPNIPAVTGFNLSNLSNLALAPAGTPPFKTTYGNVAPRVGLAYRLSQNQDWGLVLRSGFGVFYDLVGSEVGNLAGFGAYPFGAFTSFPSGTFPLDPGTAAPPPITPATLRSGTLTAMDPNLRLPYTLEWNVALEQALGKQQTVSASYIGSAGKRLLQSAIVSSPNPNFGSAYLVANTATSDYNALQLQFQRRLTRGLQALASYTWSHSIDTASAGSIYGNGANVLLPELTGLNPNSNRGPSDFDIRNAFSAGLTYEVPAPKSNAFTETILRGWSLESIIQARSAPPANVFEESYSSLYLSAGEVRPDVVPGQPFYLYGPQYPGGKAFNPAAFTNPPTDPTTGIPLRQGNLGRNALRGFGATQWDFAVHRDFPVHESVKLQFRAEMFNVLNHPNFGPPQGVIGFGSFGQSTETLAQSLGANLGNGGFNSLYQIGGPRAIQLALKLIF